MSGCDFIDVSSNPKAKIRQIVIVLIDCQFCQFSQTFSSSFPSISDFSGLVDGFTLPFKLEILAGTCTGRVPLLLKDGCWNVCLATLVGVVGGHSFVLLVVGKNPSCCNQLIS